MVPTVNDMAQAGTSRQIGRRIVLIPTSLRTWIRHARRQWDR